MKLVAVCFRVALCCLPVYGSKPLWAQPSNISDVRSIPLEDFSVHGWTEALRAYGALVKRLQGNASKEALQGINQLRYTNLFRCWLSLQGQKPLITGEKNRKRLLHLIADEYRLCLDYVRQVDDPFHIFRANSTADEALANLSSDIKELANFGDTGFEIGTISQYKAAVARFRSECSRRVEESRPK